MFLMTSCGFAVEHLKSCGRSNVLYNMAKAIGTMREDQGDSLLPAKRMPMGLIEHCVNLSPMVGVNVFPFWYEICEIVLRSDVES